MAATKPTRARRAVRCRRRRSTGGHADRYWAIALACQKERAGLASVSRVVLDAIRTTGYTDMADTEAAVGDAAQFFKVLADEARLKMLWVLFNHRELCVCDIMAALEITQSKASRHLSTLRHANLVTDRKEGLWSYYALRPVEDAFTRDQLELLKASLAKRSDAAPLLTKLHEWLEAKNRGAVCATDAACAAAKPKTRKRPRRVPLEGASR